MYGLEDSDMSKIPGYYGREVTNNHPDIEEDYEPTMDPSNEEYWLNQYEQGY